MTSAVLSLCLHTDLRHHIKVGIVFTSSVVGIDGGARIGHHTVECVTQPMELIAEGNPLQLRELCAVQCLQWDGVEWVSNNGVVDTTEDPLQPCREGDRTLCTLMLGN